MIGRAARNEAVAQEIRAGGGEALTVETDVSDPAALDRLAARVHEHWGDVRVLVNNAGIETLGFSWELSAADWERTLGVNIHGVIHGVRAFAPRMIASGKPGFIANVSSIGGLSMMPLQTSYILSKHAVLSYSECLSMEMQLINSAVQVSAILPGLVATRIFDDASSGSADIAAQHRDLMHGMLRDGGISPREAASRIFTRIADGEFWVSTHPEMTAECARNRAAHLVGLQRPQVTPEMLAILGKADGGTNT